MPDPIWHELGTDGQVPADGCCGWPTTEIRVNSLSLAILPILIPSESPESPYVRCMGGLVPWGALRQAFYPWRFLMPPEPTASLN